jgi:hypothetical protein
MYYKNGENEEAITALRLAIQGGTTERGEVVQGLPLEPGDDRILEFYYTYGLALAKDGQCGMAGEIFEALLRVAPDNEIVVTNAQEGLRICGEAPATITPESSETPTP